MNKKKRIRKRTRRRRRIKQTKSDNDKGRGVLYLPIEKKNELKYKLLENCFNLNIFYSIYQFFLLLLILFVCSLIQMIQMICWQNTDRNRHNIVKYYSTFDQEVSLSITVFDKISHSLPNTIHMACQQIKLCLIYCIYSSSTA